MASPVNREFAELVGDWRDEVGRWNEKAASDGRRVLEKASPQTFDTAAAALDELRSALGAAVELTRELRQRVRALREEQRAADRFSKAGQRMLERELAASFVDRPERAPRDWLNAILDAVRAQEWDAAERIANGSYDFGERAPGAERIRKELAAWRRGDDKAALALLGRLARRKLRGWEAILDPRTRARAHRLAAWVSLRRLNDPESALTHLNAAIELEPHSAVSHGERAGYFLATAELERGLADAQRAVDLAPDAATGHLQLGAWAELSGLYGDAAELYRTGLALMSRRALAALATRASIAPPSGALLMRAAQALHEAGDSAAAQRTIDAALAAGVQGEGLYPEADAYGLRSTILEDVPGMKTDAALAAVEAAKRYLWRGEPDRAVRHLERARSLDESITEIGWLLADAQTSMSFPPGERRPNRKLAEEALATWEATAKAGLPAGGMSWAFLTRAMIADLTTYHPDAPREQGLCEAVLYVERALVHDATDGQRWGMLARYARALDLEETAFEAVERGFALSPGDRTVLSERLALLSQRGRAAEADETARALILRFGDDPWVRGVQAWNAIVLERFKDALGFLELPLSGSYNLGHYHNLSALCHLGLAEGRGRRRRVDAARTDYAATLARTEEVGGPEFCQLAIASISLRKRKEAARWIARAKKDRTARRVERLAGEALAAFADDDLESGKRLLEEMLRAITTPHELDTSRQFFLLRLRVFDADGHAKRTRTARAVFDRVAPERRAALEEQPPTPDAEIERALKSRDLDAGPELDVRTAALLAIRSRRAASAGAYLEAADGYERLRPVFDPEASIALANALHAASAEAAARGRPEEVERIQGRLVEVGASEAADAGLAVVAACRAAGDLGRARERLVPLLENFRDGFPGRNVRRVAGEVALAAGDADEALEHFAAGLRSATAEKDADAVAEFETLSALSAIAAGKTSAAEKHAHRAVEGWREAGAVDPVWIVLQEAQRLVAEEPATRGTALADALQEILVGLAHRRALPDVAASDVDDVADELRRAALGSLGTSSGDDPRPIATSPSTGDS